MNIEFGHNKNSRDLGIKFHNVSYFDNNTSSENEKVDLFLHIQGELEKDTKYSSQAKVKPSNRDPFKKGKIWK